MEEGRLWDWGLSCFLSPCENQMQPAEEGLTQDFLITKNIAFTSHWDFYQSESLITTGPGQLEQRACGLWFILGGAYDSESQVIFFF